MSGTRVILGLHRVTILTEMSVTLLGAMISRHRGD